MAPHERASDLRKHARAKVDLDVTYACEGARASQVADASNRAVAVDLGGGGVRLATHDDLPLGTVLLLRFNLPGSERELAVRGRIVLSFYNANEKRYMHGIAFTQIDPRDQESVVSFVEACAPGA